MNLIGVTEKKEIDFRPKWKISIIVSTVLFVISLLFIFTKGMNLSIDFEGGGIWEVPVEGSDINVADVRADLSSIAETRVQEVFDSGGNRESIRVQADVAALDNSDEIRAALAESVGVTNDAVSESTVGPTWGDQITNKAIRALIFFFIAVAVYLAWTLEWRMAVGALIAVFHDLVITAGVYSIVGFEVSPATVIALLTILGYSLYDTVVVYDKVKDNEQNPLLNTTDYTGLVNLSMNQVLMRSINTTITTVVPVLSMLVVGGIFLKAGGLTGFALALFIGLILGVYSSIFIAAPTIAWLRNLLPEDKKEAALQAKRAAVKSQKDKGPKLGGDVESVVAEDKTDSVVSTASGVIAPKARKNKRR